MQWWLGLLGGTHNFIDMKIIAVYSIMLAVLYHNWTDMGTDNERRALDNIKNSQGMLVKLGVEE